MEDNAACAQIIVSGKIPSLTYKACVAYSEVVDQRQAKRSNPEPTKIIGKLNEFVLLGLPVKLEN